MKISKNLFFDNSKIGHSNGLYFVLTSKKTLLLFSIFYLIICFAFVIPTVLIVQVILQDPAILKDYGIVLSMLMYVACMLFVAMMIVGLFRYIFHTMQLPEKKGKVFFSPQDIREIKIFKIKDKYDISLFLSLKDKKFVLSSGIRGLHDKEEATKKAQDLRSFLQTQVPITYGSNYFLETLKILFNK